MNTLKKLFGQTQLVALIALMLLPAFAQAHPGHGFGSLGHDLQHALWNFFGIVVLAALIMLAGKLPATLRIKRKRKDNDQH